MTNPTIPPCPVCGKLLIPSNYNGTPCLVGTESCSGCGGYHSLMPEVSKHSFDGILGRACRELCIETVEQLKAKMQPDQRVAVLEKNLAKLTDKLAMVEQESEQRLSAIIGYSDQLLAMKEKYEPVPQNEPHPDGCFSSDPNDIQDCGTDGHYSCKDCKRNSLIAAQRGEG